MNTYKVNVKLAGRNSGLGAVRVQATDKAAAPAEAIKAMVRHAKESNAKWDNQGLPEWARESENHADYEVWGSIRKVPTKVAA